MKDKELRTPDQILDDKETVVNQTLSLLKTQIIEGLEGSFTGTTVSVRVTKPTSMVEPLRQLLEEWLKDKNWSIVEIKSFENYQDGAGCDIKIRPLVMTGRTDGVFKNTDG